MDGGLTFCAHPMPQPLVATIYFVSFIVVATFCLFSMFIGAITLGMASSMAEQRLLAAQSAVAPAPADMIRQSQHHAAQRGSTIATTTTTMMMMDKQHHAVPHRNVQQQHNVTTHHRHRRSKAQVHAHDADVDADALSGSAVDRLRLSKEVEDAVAPTEDLSTTPEDANDVRPVDAAVSSRRVMPVDAHHHRLIHHHHHHQLQSVETGVSSS